MATVPPHTTNHQEPDTLLKFHVSYLLNTILSFCVFCFTGVASALSKLMAVGEWYGSHAYIDLISLPKIGWSCYDSHAISHMPWMDVILSVIYMYIWNSWVKSTAYSHWEQALLSGGFGIRASWWGAKVFKRVIAFLWTGWFFKSAVVKAHYNWPILSPQKNKWEDQS